jgi:hypothetical protein
MVVVEGRVELVCPMDAAAIDNHHDFFAGFTQGRHDLMDILAQLLGIKMRDDLIEDFRCPKLDGANHAEQHAAGDAAPGAIVQPSMAFERLFPFDLTLAQGTRGQAIALGTTPPAPPGERKAPEDGFICIEQNNLTPARLILEGRESKRAVGEFSWGGGQLAGGAVVAEIFFNTPRTLSRPRWSPVSRAKTVASSRQLHWEWREPCSRGS